MDEEKYVLLSPLRYIAAAMIAAGGSMHGIGLATSVMDGQQFSWWFWMIFLFAIPAYLLSAIFILKNWRTGYLITMAAPIIGGLLIFAGFVFPESQLLILIPGTYENEIKMIGFLTLITEPIAVVCSGFLIFNKIWEFDMQSA